MDMNELMWNVLEEIYLEDYSNPSQAIMCVDNIKVKTNINQTIQHTTYTQLIPMKILLTDSDMVSSWSKTEAT